MADPRTALIEDLYRAFNRRDADGVLAHLAPGVDWPNATSGGREHGRAAVKAYWQKQWAEIDPVVEPERIETDAAGLTHVRVDQLVRSLDGKVLSHREVEHVYEFDGAFITRMTIVAAAPEADDDDA